jgi:hypothetical protein
MSDAQRSKIGMMNMAIKLCGKIGSAIRTLALVGLCAGAIAPAQAYDPTDLVQLKMTRDCPKCELAGADLFLSNLEGANLAGANLAKADLRGANLREANLSGANLMGADLRGVALDNANLTGTRMDNAKRDGPGKVHRGFF